MNRTQFVVAFSLYGIGMLLVGYGIGCLKTRGEIMEAIARSVVTTYSEYNSQK